MENSFHYALKKPKLTVRSVKNRNMRNKKKKEKVEEPEKPSAAALSRSQTFNGYDNFAYRRSITELTLPPKIRENAMDAVPHKPSAASQTNTVEFKENIPPPNVVSASTTQFRATNRIASYNWPVTSFYTEDRSSVASLSGAKSKKNDMQKECRYSSLSNLSKCEESSKFSSFIKKSNLRRHCSVGYLQDELYEYNFTRRKRLVDNITSEYKEEEKLFT